MKSPVAAPARLWRTVIAFAAMFFLSFMCGFHVGLLAYAGPAPATRRLQGTLAREVPRGSWTVGNLAAELELSRDGPASFCRQRTAPLGSARDVRRARRGDELRAKLCALQAEDGLAPGVRPMVVFVDTSRVGGKARRYFAQRDQTTWRMAYENAGFQMKEATSIAMGSTAGSRLAQDPSRWTVELCMGLRRTSESCLRPSDHALLKPHQRINQFNGIREILWTKDAFCDTLNEALSGFEGSQGFTFPCWVLPRDTAALQAAMAKGKGETSYIVKATSTGEGRGIFIAETYQDIEADRQQHGRAAKGNLIVQPLMEDPFLIDGYKFDLRTYVLVTSISPLRVYMYDEGLVRFAATKFHDDGKAAPPDDGKAANASVPSGKKGRRKDQYLTNTSVGKKFRALKDLTWTFDKLRKWFDDAGLSSNEIFSSMEQAIALTLLASEHAFRRHFRREMDGEPCRGCYQLLGVDIILRADSTPVVIEVNGMPSMQLNAEEGDPEYDITDDYVTRKLNLTYDIVRLLYQPLPVAQDVLAAMDELGVGIAPGSLCQEELHHACVSLDAAREMIRARREWLSRGAFRRVHPPPDGARPSAAVRDLSQHVHGLIAAAGRRDAWPAETTTWAAMPLAELFGAWYASHGADGSRTAGANLRQP